mgnify:FL=1
MTAIDINLSLDQALPSESKYLSKADVTQPLILEIFSFSHEELTVGEGEKLIMSFNGATKPMVMNVTNKNRLMLAHPDCQGLGDYKGKKIKVFFDANVEYSGKTVGGIRIDANYNGQAPAAGIDPNDDIPF